jgi:hypothetical protein
MERLWDFFVDTMVVLFMPLVCSYYALSASVFINVSAQNATGLEWLGNTLLTPTHYILAGKEAIPSPDGNWKFVQRFDYSNAFWLKATSSLLALPSSFVLGTAVKGLSLIEESARQRQNSMIAAIQSKEVHSNLALYEEAGLQMAHSLDTLIPQGHQRRPGDDQVLAVEKRALAEIAALFNQAGIPWWIDCGSCLGAYRYGGAIPWDGDIDIAVLEPDFINVCHVLNQLDPKKYIVQDWSTREFPNSFIKVYVRETNSLIDIYYFSINRDSRELQYIFSLENCIFFPDWCKVRERRFKAPVAFDTVFPLKKALFDNVEVFVPNDTKKYLQRCYGENLDPVKVFNPVTNRYEKDLSHPYWQRAHAH